jgi:hypothetical protein
MYGFIQSLISDRADHATTWKRLAKSKLTSDYLQELIDGDTNINDRKSAKRWMNANLERIGEWRLFELWMAENQDQVKRFEDTLVRAAIATAKLAYPIGQAT